jgi:quercetin dioxygenase-like cupin family protein
MQYERTRTREPEPEQGSLYEQTIEHYQRAKERVAKGRVVIREREAPWEQGRQGRIQHYIHRNNWPEIAAPGWTSFVHDIRRHSGKHRHQGGIGLFVIEGKGYTVVNERRFDWDKGDLILLPVQAGGCVHQHFNEAGTESAKWLSLIPSWAKEPLAQEIVQREVSPDWKAMQPNADERIPELEEVDEQRQRVRQEQQRGEGSKRTDSTLLGSLIEQRDRERRALQTARMVIKGKDIQPEVNQMGIFYWYTHPHMRDIGCRTLLVYVQEIPVGSRSGQQLHQGGRLHYVWEGRGHTILDGARHEWQAGDMILLPVKFDGTVHQHFNDGDTPAKLLCAEANWFDLLGVDMGPGFEIFESCPEYRG